MSYWTEIFITFVVAVLLWPLYCYYTNIYKIEKFLKKIPGPPKVPFFGNSLAFSKPELVLDNYRKYIEKYGSKVYLNFGIGASFLLTTDREFLEFLLQNGQMLNSNLEFFVPLVGRGIGTLTGPKWKARRKLLVPTFHIQILEQFVDIFEFHGDILVGKLSEQSGNTNLDISPYISNCAFDSICETAMGTKLNVQNYENSEYFNAIKIASQIAFRRATSNLKRYDFFFRFTEDYVTLQKSSKIARNYTNEVVKTRRQKLDQKSQNETEDVDDVGIKTKKVFLDLLLDTKSNEVYLNEEDILSEVTQFMFAGYDTATTSVSFALYALAHNRYVQDKVLEEQRQIYGDEKNPKVTFKDLQEMRYLENVIKESMRVFTPAPLIFKTISEDLKYHDMIIPKGLDVGVFFYGLHRNPEYFPNPEIFDPDRFENAKFPPFVFCPFSEGPRLCIGHKFANTEIKVLVSKIIRNFEVFPATPKHAMKLVPELVMKSLNGVKIGLKLR